MPEKGKVRGIPGEGSFRYGRANRSFCGEVAKDPSNHLVAGSLRNFSHFQEKSEWLEDSGTRCSRPFLKPWMGKIQCLLPREPSRASDNPYVDQSLWTEIWRWGMNLTLREGAAQDEQKSLFFSMKNERSYSEKTLFHWIGLVIYGQSYSVKQCFSD